ncbi:hypothetical protein Pan44_16210 [Caulifigura coniformis]|uniref:Uncharacterized protein n=1 Tax=Caulifigura coniformis TaxID=2527983 RepID=A0A517SBU2_9PLAN|nr:hypothetical protein Pan44_16210 [Caulifigura coniformis]
MRYRISHCSFPSPQFRGYRCFCLSVEVSGQWYRLTDDQMHKLLDTRRAELIGGTINFKSPPLPFRPGAFF